MEQKRLPGNKVLLVMLLASTHLLVGYLAYMVHYFYPNLGGL